jgi:glyoxylase-like metal-dependent hydrolase (beta-lactamase superfamily II)
MPAVRRTTPRRFPGRFCDMTGIRFYRDFEFEYSVLETVSPLVRRIVARNPGAFTGPGTGTFVIGRGRVALIDPGPALSSHVQAILHALRNETIENILITHSHVDHWPATEAIRRATGASVYGWGDRGGYGFVPDHAMRDGDTLEGPGEAPGWHITAVHTPGHASDHLCFALDEERTLFSGDHVMGWSTSVIIPPDGSLGDYMRSLAKLLPRNDAVYLPTHGPAITDPKSHVTAFIAHRNERTAAILARLAEGQATIPEIVRSVYVDVSPGLHGAAALSVEAHLIELMREGKVAAEEGGFERRYRLAGA